MENISKYLIRFIFLVIASFSLYGYDAVRERELEGYRNREAVRLGMMDAVLKGVVTGALGTALWTYIANRKKK